MSVEGVVPVRRRYRLFAVPSGLLLFVCMFLPFIERCGEPVYPYEAPVATAPHVLGLVVALVAMVGAPVRAAALQRARLLTALAVVFWSLTTAWFALWASISGALIGASLSLAGSAWMTVAALIRLRDLRAAAAASLPQARIGITRTADGGPTPLWLVLMVLSVLAAAVALPATVPPRPEPPPTTSDPRGFCLGMCGC